MTHDDFILGYQRGRLGSSVSALLMFRLFFAGRIRERHLERHKFAIRVSPKRGVWVIPNCSNQSWRLALSATGRTHRNDLLEFRQIPLDVSGNPQSVLCSCELIKSFVRQRSRHDESADLMGRSERKDSEHDDHAQRAGR